MKASGKIQTSSLLATALTNMGRTLRIFSMVLAALFILNACLQTENSSSGDTRFDTGGTNDTPVDTTDPNFAPAIAVIKSECISCHTGYHSTMATTAQGLIDQGYVVQGSPNSSLLYQQLQNSDAPTGAKDMPYLESPLSAADLLKIKTWIAGMP